MGKLLDTALGKMAFGVLAMVGGWIMFMRFTAWEEQGGTMTAKSITFFLYDNFGRWGVLNTGLILGVLCIIAGSIQLIREK